ncbi:MAG: hypothetical protein ACLFQR_13180 [Desulfovibrionales bacterium]
MTNAQLQAGSPVDSMCLKCKELTSHTVIAMDGERVLKVQCKLCGGRHALRSPTDAKTKGKTAKAKAPTKKAAAAALKKSVAVKEWQKQVDQADQNRAKDYSMSGIFEKGDLVEHPSFGKGVVQSVIHPDKMEVLFEDGLKLMRCSLE